MCTLYDYLNLLCPRLCHRAFDCIYLKVGSRDIDDARLMYRLSCKGPPCFELPRTDTSTWLQEHISPPYTTPHPLPHA